MSTIHPLDTGSPTPTVTHYQEVAVQLKKALSEAQALIPTFAPAHAVTKEFVQKYQSFPDPVIGTAIAAVEGSAELQRIGKFNILEARDTQQFIEAFRSCIDQTEVLLRDMKFTVAARKANVIAEALQLYEIAKGLGRDPDSADVAAHAQNLRRDIRRGRSRRLRVRVLPSKATYRPISRQGAAKKDWARQRPLRRNARKLVATRSWPPRTGAGCSG